MELRLSDRIHFIGIGGVSMSALAHALVDMGYRVSGSDRGDGPVLAGLRQAGIEAYVGHAAEHVFDTDVVVYTTAIAADSESGLLNNIAVSSLAGRGMVGAGDPAARQMTAASQASTKEFAPATEFATTVNIFVLREGD